MAILRGVRRGGLTLNFQSPSNAKNMNGILDIISRVSAFEGNSACVREKQQTVNGQEDLASLNIMVDQLIRYYNHDRRHSTLGNQSPARYLKEKGKMPG